MGLTHIASHDGTPIAVHSGGSGQPLLLIHGATADHSTTWQHVLDAFEARFTTYRMDRRGRSESGDADTYAMEREFEDVAAVVEAIGESVSVVGHSYGAGVALGALTLTDRIAALVHYEGGIPAEQRTPEDMIERMETQLAVGDRESALETMYRDIVGIDPAWFRSVSGEAAWEARLRNVHTLPRELRAENDFHISAIEDALRSVPTPVLLLLGGDSPPALTEPSRRLAHILPNVRIESMPGESHAAMFGSPEAFVGLVTDFISEAVHRSE